MTVTYRCKLVVFPLMALCCLFMSLAASGQAILASSTTKHAFSDPKTQDVFKLTVRGASLLKGTATIEIFNAANKSIYKEVFKAYWLLSSLDVNDFHWNDKQQEEQIRKRVREFFNEKNFFKPAINKKEQYDVDYVKKEDWDDVYSNPAAIGFGFLKDYEAHKKIAWSKRRGKVVVYMACC